MHFKRKGPKSTRAGCLMCTPNKRQGVTRRNRNMKWGSFVRSFSQREALRDAGLRVNGKDSRYRR